MANPEGAGDMVLVALLLLKLGHFVLTLNIHTNQHPPGKPFHLFGYDFFFKSESVLVAQNHNNLDLHPENQFINFNLRW